MPTTITDTDSTESKHRQDQENLKRVDHSYNSILASALECSFKNESYRYYQHEKDRDLKELYQDAADTSSTIYTGYSSPGFFSKKKSHDNVRKALFLILLYVIHKVPYNEIKLKHNIKDKLNITCFQSNDLDSANGSTIFDDSYHILDWDIKYKNDFKIENNQKNCKNKEWERVLSEFSDNPYNPLWYSLLCVLAVLSGLTACIFGSLNTTEDVKLFTSKYDCSSDILIIGGACLFVIGCYFLFRKDKYYLGLKSEINAFYKRCDEKSIKTFKTKSVPKTTVPQRCSKKTLKKDIISKHLKKKIKFTPCLPTIKESTQEEKIPETTRVFSPTL